MSGTRKRQLVNEAGSRNAKRCGDRKRTITGKASISQNKAQKEGGYDMRRQLRVQRKARFRAAPQDR
jgi:hypothetical protein